jgi:hypothetical protein
VALICVTQTVVLLPDCAKVSQGALQPCWKVHDVQRQLSLKHANSYLGWYNDVMPWFTVLSAPRPILIDSTTDTSYNLSLYNFCHFAYIHKDKD